MSLDTRGEWPLGRLLSEVVGSGPKSASDMTAEQAGEAMDRIIDGRPDPTTLGAFLLANRWKRNTPAELAAFVDVMRERSVRTAQPDADPVDCGANYDGKVDTALLGVGAAAVAAAAGTPVTIHAADRIPATSGVSYRHVLGELGVTTDLAPSESARMIDEVGVGFYDALRFNPEIHALLDRREAMVVRTFINTIETLANPAEATAHLGSFFHLSFARKVIDTVRTSRTLDVERVLMIQGVEGYDDLRPGRARIAEWDGDDIKDDEIDTEQYGMTTDVDDLRVDAVATDSARITESVLAGKRDDRFADAITLNAALRIYAGGDARSLEEGVEAARDAIASGDARSVLAKLRAFDTCRSR